MRTSQHTCNDIGGLYIFRYYGGVVRRGFRCLGGMSRNRRRLENILEDESLPGVADGGGGSRNIFLHNRDDEFSEPLLG